MTGINRARKASLNLLIYSLVGYEVLSGESYLLHIIILAIHRPRISIMPGTQPAKKIAVTETPAVTA